MVMVSKSRYYSITKIYHELFIITESVRYRLLLTKTEASLTFRLSASAQQLHIEVTVMEKNLFFVCYYDYLGLAATYKYKAYSESSIDQ